MTLEVKISILITSLHRDPYNVSDWVLLVRSLVGGAVASWLVRSTPERVVQVRALAEDIVFCSGQDTFLSQCLSPPRSITGYRRI